jgi:hypothetical protein
MRTQSTFSPVSLRYIAALHGNTPKRAGDAFTYADATCDNPENLLCLADSNPEGFFYGFTLDDATKDAAEELASQRHIDNISFFSGSVAAHDTLPAFDYLCFDDREASLSPENRAALFALARERLNPNGLLIKSYAAQTQDDGALRFLIQQLAPQMDAAQKQDFLSEIKKLGAYYFFKDMDVADALDKAIAEKTPEAFFALFNDATANSGTFDTLIAAATTGFTYAGDAALSSNYVELAVPLEAQDIIVTCKNSPVYEVIKDFALNRITRSDIWIKEPRGASTSPAELFGGFAYGLTTSRDQVPSFYAAKGKRIDLSAPEFEKILDLMALMPIGVGDVLSHPSTKDIPAEKILEVFQLLVACGFANPMRGVLKEISLQNASAPKLAGGFNSYLDKTTLTSGDVLFASQTAGCGIFVPAREAFVIQALNRGGLLGSAKALVPELTRIAATSDGEAVMATEEPTPETAHKIVLKAIEESLPRWYAYALLEAA